MSISRRTTNCTNHFADYSLDYYFVVVYLALTFLKTIFNLDSIWYRGRASTHFSSQEKVDVLCFAWNFSCYAFPPVRKASNCLVAFALTYNFIILCRGVYYCNYWNHQMYPSFPLPWWFRRLSSENIFKISDSFCHIFYPSKRSVFLFVPWVVPRTRRIHFSLVTWSM